MPCRISRSPYFTRRSQTEIAGAPRSPAGSFFEMSCPAMVAMPLVLSRRREVEDGSHNKIHEDDQENRLYHSRSGRFADSLRAETGCKAFLTPDSGDHNSENDALDQTDENVATYHSVDCRLQIGMPAESGTHHPKEAAAEDAGQV